MEKILIIGVLGQDGTLLSSILPKDKYEIFGVSRPNSNINKIEHHIKNFDTRFYFSDFTNYENVVDICSKIKPNIIVNFAGVSNVFKPWDNVDSIYQNNCQLPLNVLDYIRNYNREIFLFQSSSSLIYGRSKNSHVNHLSQYAPIYPYGITKLYTQNFMAEYRENFNIHCSNGVFFNHESEYRGKDFLSKKVAKFVSDILKGGDGKLKLGNLESKRDISHAKDFMSGVFHIIENKFNDDFIFSSNHSVKIEDFVKLFFLKYNLDFNEFIELDTNLVRTNEPNVYGDNTKLSLTGWKPKLKIDDIVSDMVEFELKNNSKIY